MHGYYYLYTGPTYSIFSIYSNCLLLPNNIDEMYEYKVPSLKNLFYTKKLDCSKFPINYLNTQIIDSDYINMYGRQGLHKIRSKSYLICRSFLKNYDLSIKEICNPKTWPERLTVLNAVLCRKKYIQRFEVKERIKIIDIEECKETQLEFLQSLKILPPYINWYKAMELFIDVYPKPLWYEKELKDYRRLCNE